MLAAARIGEVGVTGILGFCRQNTVEHQEQDEEEEDEDGEEAYECCDVDPLGGGKDSYNRARRQCYYGVFQSPLPMATTPPLSAEQLQAADARRQAELSRCNTWERIAAAGLYAIGLWKLSQEMIEEKAKNVVDTSGGKQKVL